ncbi:hydrolase [Peptacetobacter hominis]|uniref:Hydrolase n=1 Tax=Peptacetobacter hominis TaxID=2743610 RepID=A0A544QWD3_9FIRM|nr:hydrolase [Peptacetobacter hominis]TQQ85007.1 hydrolase [Peptacetobacter hominis]
MKEIKFEHEHNVVHKINTAGETVVPVIESRLKQRIVNVPKEIDRASGIVVFGKKIKSLIFSTDISIIKNNNADAVFAVYPFTPQRSINDAVMDVSPTPVFCGVGGGLTSGRRSVDIALDAELHGAFGVVLNAPATDELIMDMKETIDIPIVITVCHEREDVSSRIESGASILNVSAGKNTPKVVRKIRKEYPYIPIIATGGNTPESIIETIDAGANAITYTPPSIGEIFSGVMEKYRDRFR